jgi:PhnO protein
MRAIIIRNAEPIDFEFVHDFVTELSHGGVPMDEMAQRQIFIGNISNPDNIYLLASVGSITVGFLSCHIQNLLHHGGPVGEIQEMFVAESARSLGVGKKLTDRLKEIAQERNVLQLEVTSGFKRESAHRFYEREAFEHTHKKFVYKL